MQLHSKKKVEIVVEAACAKRLIEMIEAAGASGYTVVPQVAGKGVRGVRDEAHVSDVYRNVMIVVVAQPEVAMRIVERSQPLLENYAGCVWVTDVQVVRDAHF
jgi:nitrogen regulatory protein PII